MFRPEKTIFLLQYRGFCDTKSYAKIFETEVQAVSYGNRFLQYGGAVRAYRIILTEITLKMPCFPKFEVIDLTRDPED